MPPATIHHRHAGPWTLAILLAVAAASTVFGHDDLHKQIAAVTIRLAAEPDNVALYLKRAELHRLHEDWDAAFIDLEQVARRDADHESLDFARGQLFLSAGWGQSALLYIDRFLIRHAEHGPALLVRARALGRLERFDGAAGAYDLALDHLERHLPEHYIERARLCVQAGDMERALRGLDEGVGKLGPIVQLQLEAVELELALERYDAALARLDPFLQTAQRKESWLMRRAAILEQAQRPAAASQQYQLALAAIEALPPRHRFVPATRELAAQAQAAIDRLADPSDGEGNS